MGSVIITTIEHSNSVIFSDGQSLEELDKALFVIDLSRISFGREKLLGRQIPLTPDEMTSLNIGKDNANITGNPVDHELRIGL